jgi:hypothetical protein
MAERELFARLRLGIQGDPREAQSGQSGERKRAERDRVCVTAFWSPVGSIQCWLLYWYTSFFYTS